jgi:hypothetical protein
MSSAGTERGTKYIVRVEHSVGDFDAWKAAFDSDPVGRKKSGVRRYRVLRAEDDPKYVMIDLEFGSSQEAETFRARLGQMWAPLEGKLIGSPRARIVHAVEYKEL